MDPYSFIKHLRNLNPPAFSGHGKFFLAGALRTLQLNNHAVVTNRAY